MELCVHYSSCQGLIVYHFVASPPLLKYLPTPLVGNPIIKILDTPLYMLCVCLYVCVGMYVCLCTWCVLCMYVWVMCTCVCMRACARVSHPTYHMLNDTLLPYSSLCHILHF